MESNKKELIINYGIELYHYWKFDISFISKDSLVLVSDSLIFSYSKNFDKQFEEISFKTIKGDFDSDYFQLISSDKQSKKKLLYNDYIVECGLDANIKVLYKGKFRNKDLPLLSINYLNYKIYKNDSLIINENFENRKLKWLNSNDIRSISVDKDFPFVADATIAMSLFSALVIAPLVSYNFKTGTM